MIQFDWNTYFLKWVAQPPPCSIFNQKKDHERCDQSERKTWLPGSCDQPDGRDPKTTPKMWAKKFGFSLVIPDSRLIKKKNGGGLGRIRPKGSHPNSKRRQWVIFKNSKQKPMVVWSLQLNMQTENASLQETRYFLFFVSMSSSFI